MGTLVKPMSDLHIDVNRRPFVDQTDEHSKDTTLMLAGDICEIDSLNQYVKFLEDICPSYRHVLLCLGNHEYYSGSIHRAKDKLMEKVAKIPNLIFMDRNTIIIDDVKFIGATLWTDMNKADPIFMMNVSDRYVGMNDYRQIRWGTKKDPYVRRLRSQDVLGYHRKDLEYIKSQLTYDTRKTVVMTHHAPCMSIIQQGPYAGHHLNPAYASHLEELVADSNIDLWVNGHVHYQYDVDFFDTRLICNSRGYNDSESTNFNPNFVIEL